MPPLTLNPPVGLDAAVVLDVLDGPECLIEIGESGPSSEDDSSMEMRSGTSLGSAFEDVFEDAFEDAGGLGANVDAALPRRPALRSTLVCDDPAVPKFDPELIVDPEPDPNIEPDPVPVQLVPMFGLPPGVASVSLDPAPPPAPVPTLTPTPVPIPLTFKERFGKSLRPAGRAAIVRGFGLCFRSFCDKNASTARMICPSFCIPSSANMANEDKFGRRRAITSVPASSRSNALFLFRTLELYMCFCRNLTLFVCTTSLSEEHVKPIYIAH
jgi:hypothetical protein